MDIEVNKSLIEKLKKDGGNGQSQISLEQAKKLTSLLNDKRAQAIKLGKNCYIMFFELHLIEFKIMDFKRVKDLEFIPSSDLEFIDATKEEIIYPKFVLNELIQGEGIARVGRLITTLLPLALLNILAYKYATLDSLKDAFVGILTGVSIFIALFALFTTSHEYLERKKLVLFDKGKLSYYFSIDRHITRTGISTIVLSVLGIITSGNTSALGISSQTYKLKSFQSYALILFINLAFLGVFIILRSLLEFYVKRPGAFIMGDLKSESFKNFINKQE